MATKTDRKGPKTHRTAKTQETRETLRYSWENDMDRFVESGQTRGSTQPWNANGGNAAERKKKMAPEEKEQAALAAERRKTNDTHS